MPVRMKSRIPKITLELEGRSRAGVATVAEAIVERAKEKVPVDTGALRDAIHTEETEVGVAVIAGDTDAFYGHMVEHGTTHSAPHPFLIPATEEARPKASQIAGAELRGL